MLRILRPNSDSMLNTMTDCWCKGEVAECIFAISKEISGVYVTNQSIRAEQANRVRFDIIAKSSFS